MGRIYLALLLADGGDYEYYDPVGVFESLELAQKACQELHADKRVGMRYPERYNEVMHWQLWEKESPLTWCAKTVDCASYEIFAIDLNKRLMPTSSEWAAISAGKRAERERNG